MAVTEGPSALTGAGVVTVLGGLGGMVLLHPAGTSVLVLGGLLLIVSGLAIAAEFSGSDSGRRLPSSE